MYEKEFISPHPFNLECGKTLNKITIKYTVSCKERADKKVIWICHALTANANPSEWWNTLVGSGKLFDPQQHYIVCANILGSCYGSTGPSSNNEHGKPYLLDFPPITIRDLVQAHELLREHLKINSIELLIGGSNGGFQAIEWAVSNPYIIKNLCLIATNAIVSPWCTAFNQSQRLALKADPTFTMNSDPGGGKAGLAAARSIALLSYRSYSGYNRTQNEEEENADFLIAKKASSYQNYQGKKLVERFNAYSYYTLSLNVDSHNIGRGRGGLEKSLKRITAKTLCIAIDSDLLFPQREMKRVADGIERCAMEVISSEYGHDGFLLEYKQLEEKIKRHIPL